MIPTSEGWLGQGSGGGSEVPDAAPPVHPRIVVALCAAGVLLIGSAGLLGWLLDVSSLRRILPDLAAMEAATAVGFVLSALALWLSWRRPRGRLALALALVVALVAALALAGHALSGLMAPATAVAFLLFSLAVVALPLRRPPIAGLAALACAAVAGLALVTYAYDLRALHGVRAFSNMALHTAVGFLLLAVGVSFTRPDRGLVGLANREGAGPALVRRLVPWAVAVPVVAGWLRIEGERAGLYPPHVGTALLVLVTVGLLVIAIAWTARGIAASEEHRRRERRRAEGRFRVAVEASPSGMIMVDEDGSIVMANSEVERLFGYAADEMLGMPVETLVPERFRTGHRELRATYNAAPAARPMGAGRELYGQRRDGTEFPLEIALNPVPTEQGMMVLGSVVDITARRQQEEERERLQAQLLQSQKLESVGRLAGGVAHDFNNVLGVIGGYGELMQHRVAGDRKLSAYLDEILKAADRAESLTRQLLAFSRRQALQPAVLDLNEVVRGMDGMLRRLLGANVELTTRLDDDLWAVRADPGQLEQVLMNLAVNARDSMPRGGKLTLETANVHLDEHYAELHPEVEAGPHVRLAVSDSGEGMDAETLSQIFDPFFTTKEKGRGTGLGLATVHGIVRQSGGHVYAYSHPGRGSTFKVYLPRVEETPGRQAVPRPEAPAAGSETVLVVEDEEALCAVARTGLEAYGYTVLTATRGAVAREICDSYGAPVHLLLTDVVMPDVGGRELAAELCARRPEMRVLYMSGYTDDTVVTHGILEQRVPYLQKPFSLTELARKVREVLDAL